MTAGLIPAPIFAVGTVVMTVNSANLRAAPALESDIVTGLAAGVLLTVTGASETV